MTLPTDATVVAQLSPPGRGAVAVVVVSGPAAQRAVDNCFVARSGRAVGSIPIGRIALGHWGGPTGEELIMCRRDDCTIEVHCHGGIAAVEAVIDRLIDEGCQRVSWQEWIRLTTIDRIAADARIALAASTTERTSEILLDQLNGALGAAIREIEVDVAAADWPSAATRVDILLERRPLGLHLCQPWRVVVFGPPNVGKSSLMNALAGFERAIVSPTPGTTRDVVSLTTAIEGWPVHLSDTAGVRESEDELESAGIQLATAVLSTAELAIVVNDVSNLRDSPTTVQASVEVSKLARDVPVIYVINKIDLLSSTELQDLLRSSPGTQPGSSRSHFISALNGDGVADLISAIARSLVPERPRPGLAVPFTKEQFEALAKTRDAIERRDSAAARELLHAMLTAAN